MVYYTANRSITLAINGSFTPAMMHTTRIGLIFGLRHLRCGLQFFGKRSDLKHLGQLCCIAGLTEQKALSLITGLMTQSRQKFIANAVT